MDRLCRRKEAVNVLDLIDATGPNAGGKAAPLAQLLQAGFNVPQGFVVPTQVYRAVAQDNGLNLESTNDFADVRARILDCQLPTQVVDDISSALEQLTQGASTDYVAVRSSSSTEDSTLASGAGQHDSFLAVRGLEQVCQAILKCWASLWSERAAAYRTRQASHHHPLDMAVVVQRFVDADVSGIIFTGDTSVIEASLGLGERIVAGQLTPDSWRVAGAQIVDRRRGDQTQRTDRLGHMLHPRPVAPGDRTKACLTDHQVLRLDAMGHAVSTTLGGHRDIEWAFDGDTLWILQARPITSELPDFSWPRRQTVDGSPTITGEPASPGAASGPVRLILGPADFATVEAGDVIVCRMTDPAWTPLFSLAAAVVTETGGVLSHAAIVAREVGIPAVLAVPQATELLKPASVVTVDGNTGCITTVES
ncbi:hypothetical protein A6F49_08565 [Enteractinococcus helveticum]|uniref:Pyruvate, water dikinase n=1 Tax=Enteractinococcus helveticum TaxID=1837282 RepID=A0A1B7M083_9MICC|nr:hypothetical protein A6F49_08565 [Enteractinococcus helveticum]